MWQNKIHLKYFVKTNISGDLDQNRVNSTGQGVCVCIENVFKYVCMVFIGMLAKCYGSFDDIHF